MTFVKGGTPWNKGVKKTKKAEKKVELFENNAPLDSEPNFAPAQPEENKKQGFFAKLFSFLK